MAQFPFGFARIGLKVSSGLAFGRDRNVMLLNSRRHEPVWAGPFTTGLLDPSERADAVAFVVDLVDRNGRVDFVHPLFAVPRAYTPATWPMAGDAELVSVTDLRTVVIGGLVIGLTLRRGDRVTLMQGALHCYRKIAEDVVVTSTISQVLKLTPRIPLGLFAAGAALRLRNAPVQLAIVPDSYDPEDTSRPTALSFDAMEALV